MEKLLDYAGISRLHAPVIENLSTYRQEHWKYNNIKRRDNEYDISRWTPVLKDICEDAIKGRLDERTFPIMKVSTSGPTSRPTSRQVFYCAEF